MEYRNPTYNALGTIDCEIHHPDFGWIPFTADPNDTGAEFDVAAMFAAMAADPTTLQYVAPTPAPVTSAEVNAERDRRLYTVFTFQGKEYDCDHVSLARITGAATLAGFAIAAGAPEGYVRWHGGETDFMWIAHDNSLTSMDAQTAFAFGQAAAENQSAHVFASDVLKRQNPIPADYTDDRHWP